MSTTIKERPIPFSGPMVRAILAGRKTQTRRIVDPQPPERMRFDGFVIMSTDRRNVGKAHWTPEGNPLPLASQVHYARCRYGRHRDRLWVRETWCRRWDNRAGGWQYNAEGNLDPSCFSYRADLDSDVCVAVDDDGFRRYRKDGSEASPWTSPLRMPRCASRLLLEITGVRVERLQEISEADAEAEGAHVDDGHVPGADAGGMAFGSSRASYRHLWESINGAGSWVANPWVWVIEFKQIEAEGRAS